MNIVRRCARERGVPGSCFMIHIRAFGFEPQALDQMLLALRERGVHSQHAHDPPPPAKL